MEQWFRHRSSWYRCLLLALRVKQDLQKATLSHFEIYNIAADPGETQNLAGRDSLPSDQQQELIRQLTSGYEELLLDSPAWKPAGR